MDAAPHRQGRWRRRGDASVDDDSYPVSWDGTEFTRADRRRPATCCSIGATPSGLFAKVDPCAAWRPATGWRRSTPRCSAYVDASTAPGSAPLEPAPDLRAVPAWPGRGGRRRLRRPRLGGPAGQARPRRHPARAAGDARRRAVDGRRRRVRVGRRPDVDAAARGGPRPVPQVRPARSSASSSSSRSTWCASTGSRTAPCSACPATRGPRSSRRSTRWAPGSAGAGSTTSTRSPTTGRCCAVATSRTPGTPTTSPATWPRGWTAARCCTSG